jgi:hypothetical protein
MAEVQDPMKERDIYGVEIDDYSDEQWLADELIIRELPGTGQHDSPDPVFDAAPLPWPGLRFCLILVAIIVLALLPRLALSIIQQPPFPSATQN